MSNYSELEEKENSPEQLEAMQTILSKYKYTAEEWNMIRTKLNDLKDLIDAINTFSGAYADLSGKPDLSLLLEKAGYTGTAQDLKNLIDTNSQDLTDFELAVAQSLLLKLDKAGYTGTAQDLKNLIDTKQQSPIVVDTATLTAENDKIYHTTVNTTITDPTGVEGKGYEVKVLAGTTTEGETINRLFESGTWVSFSNVERAIENATVTGTFNLDLTTFDVARLTLTGNTTLTVSNTPGVGKSFKKVLIVESDTITETLTIPQGWNLYGKYEPIATNLIELTISNVGGDVQVDCEIKSNIEDIAQLSYASTTDLNLGLESFDGQPIRVNWGDGIETMIASSGLGFTRVTKTFASAQSGVVLIYNAKNISAFNSDLGTWDFDIKDLPVNLTYYYNAGNNTTTGLIDNLPVNMTYYFNRGDNTTSGLVDNLPVNMTFYYNLGNNTTTGLIDNLPVNMTFYYNNGQNTTSGLVDNLPVNLITYRNEGQNTTTGLIDNLPVNLTLYYNLGQNTTSGLIDNLPANLTLYRNEGSNTTSGLVDNLPVNLTFYSNLGQNTTTYSLTTGRFWVADQNFHYLRASNMTSTMIDNYLIDLSGQATWTGSRLVDVRVAGGVAPTAASSAAISTLQGIGVTVLTN